MSDADQPAGRDLLLATDLGPGCDRALDRALLLGAQWKARVHILHVVDPAGAADADVLHSWREPSDHARVVASTIHRDLPASTPDVMVHVQEGPAAATIDRVAREQGCRLIVTGIAHNPRFGAYLAGNTVDRLIRLTPLLVLVVKRRARPYERIVVATDFSETSRHALLTTLNLFPAAQIVLLHVFGAPFGHIASGSLQEQFETMGREAADEFLGDMALTPEQAARVTLIIDRGSPAQVVGRLMDEQPIDLAVVGSHGRSAVLNVLLGSTAQRVLDSAPGDVLVVRGRGGSAG